MGIGLDSLTSRSGALYFSKLVAWGPWCPQRTCRDGPNGTRLRVLKIVALNGPIRSLEIAKALGITRRAVLYHLRILVELGLVVRVYPKPRSPFQMYVIPSYRYQLGRVENVPSGGHSVSGLGPRGLDERYWLRPESRVVVRASVRKLALAAAAVLARYVVMRPSELARELRVAPRTLRRAISVLVRLGICVRAGGLRCPDQVIIWYPYQLEVVPIHRHRGPVRHRYRRMRTLDEWFSVLELLDPENCSTGGGKA